MCSSELTLPVDRSRALGRALLWSAPAVLLGAVTVMIYGRLHFTPTGVSNRLVDFSIAVVALPAPVSAILCGLHALRWALLGVWPWPVGVSAQADVLRLHLGPFGTRRYNADELDVRYPFELSGDTEDGGYEALLPEEEQIARFLPRIHHPDAAEPLNRVILRFCRGNEADVAALLRPMLDRWRSARDEAAEP